MTTARDLITMALFDTGIYGRGLTPSGEDINMGLTRLNDMIAQWQRQRFLIYALIDVSGLCDGSVSYSIGAGQDFDTPRPDRLESAYIRQVTPPMPNSVDWPLKLVQSREAYSVIRMKELGSFPTNIWYDSSFPYGALYPWPLPSSQYELHVVLKTALQSFPNLSTDFNMPDEYKRAIRFNLEIELLRAYRLPIEPERSDAARGALEILRITNAQVPVMYMPDELVRSGIYNVFTDNTT